MSKRKKVMIKNKISMPVNVDSTPEFICETCGYHGDSCVCSAQSKSLAAKPAKTFVLGEANKGSFQLIF